MKNIAYLLVVLLSLKSTAQSLIYPYSDGHRWGLANANLDIIAKPQFDTTVFFDKETYGIAIKDKRYGAIGRDGKTLTSFTYDKLYVQAEGFGRGYTKDNGYTREGYQKFVLLDLKTGKVISQQPYDQIWHYCHCADKIFIVQKDTQTIFISGITGKQLGKGIYQGIAEFLPKQYDGLTTKAVVKTNGKFGVLDAKTGAWVVPAKYDEISQTFRHNKIAIEVIAKGVKTYLDYNGKPIQAQKP